MEEPPVRRGPRAEIVAELRRLADGWRHFGDDELAAQADEAADEFEQRNASAIRVGHTRYEVTES